MDLERLQLLLNQYFDQVLVGEDFAELEQMLLESARAREAFWEMARWHAFIRQWGQAEWGRRDAAQTGLRVLPPPRRAIAPVRKPAVRQQRSWQPLALAATIIFALVAIWAFDHWPKENASVAEAPSKVERKDIAVLTHISDAVWADGSHAWNGGESLPSGWLRLKSGAVQIEFLRGARVVLEGPADFQLTNANEGFLQSGKLHAMVPETAHGFKIQTPKFSVVDLGTEFGCMVPLTTAAEVHVFKGQVELRDPTAKTAPGRLQENQAVRFENGTTKPIAANRSSFLGEEELARREHRKSLDRLSLWREVAGELDANPATLVHFDFERQKEWERTLLNRALQAPPRSNASIIACAWENGRWPNKGALEFKRTEDRLRLNLPGSFRSLTLFAWVRVDSLPNIQNSLLMTESSLQGELHWYLYRDGSLGFGVRVNNGNDPASWRNLRSEPVVTDGAFGSWVFVATVFDGEAETVTHYFNGKPVGSDKPGIHPPLRLDTFEIGNWGVRADTLSESEQRKRVRNFHGRIDEFAILSTALDAGAIQRYYEDSRPVAADPVPAR